MKQPHQIQIKNDRNRYKVLLQEEGIDNNNDIVKTIDMDIKVSEMRKVQN